MAGRSSELVGDTDTFWILYVAKAVIHSQHRFEGTSKDLDTLLIFSGLFSAIDTAFVAIILDHDPSAHANLIKGFLIVSLTLSILAAFGGMLGKLSISNGFRPNADDSPKQHALGHQEWLRWRLEEAFQAFSIVMLLAMLSFWVGLILFLWNQTKPLAIIVLALACAGAVVFFVFALVSDIFPYSPVQARSFKYGAIGIGLFLSVIILPMSIALGAILGVGLIVVYALELYTFFRVVFRAATEAAGHVRHPLEEHLSGMMEELSFDLPRRLSIVDTDSDEEMDQEKWRKTMKRHERESHCIQWALAEIPDADLVLEAAWQIPSLKEQSAIYDLSLDHVAFNNFLFYFVKRIQSEPVTFPTEALLQSIPLHPPLPALAVYSSALAHLLLSWKAGSLNRQAIHDIAKELQYRDRQLSHGSQKFVKILSIDYPRSEPSPSPPAFYGDPSVSLGFLAELKSDFRRNLPYVYLSFNNQEAVQDTNSEGLILQCSRSLPPRPAISLIVWYLSTKREEILDVGGVKFIEKRWKFYTSSNDVARELEALPAEDVFSVDTNQTNELVLEMLNRMVDLNTETLGSGTGVESLLSNCLTCYLSGVDSDLKTRLKAHPNIFLRLASQQQVKSKTRISALKEAEDLWGQLPISLSETHIAEDLVGCARMAEEEGPTSFEECVRLIVNIARKISGDEQNQRHLLHAFHLPLPQIPLSWLSYPILFSESPTQLLHLVLLFNTLNRLTDQSVICPDIIRVFLTSLAIWGSFYGTGAPTVTTTITETRNEWSQRHFVSFVKFIIRFDNVHIPELSMAGIRMFAEFWREKLENRDTPDGRRESARLGLRFFFSEYDSKYNHGNQDNQVNEALDRQV